MAGHDNMDFLVDRVTDVNCNSCGNGVNVSGAAPFSVVKCPHCGADLPVPGMLDNFVLVKVMGKGAMGAVYQGFDQTLKRHVAIKVMLGELAEDPKFVESFFKEARSLAALNHPNIVQIYSCGQTKGQPYIVMELVSGARMDKLMEGGQPLHEVKALEICIGVAKGLKAANDIGLIHGDIKPENILLDRDGTAKVVDFGLAGAAQKSMTEVWGTPNYIAPEKARKQKEDHRADIYSLGATLYHALAGQPPFEGETARDVVLARLEAPAPSVHEIRPDVNQETADLVARMLAGGRRFFGLFQVTLHSFFPIRLPF